MSHMKINDLVAAAYATAPTLPPAATELMRNLATRLDITFIALKEAMDQRTAVIAEVSGVITACEHVYAAGYQAGHLNTVDGIAYENDTREEFAGLAVEVLAQHMEIPATDAYLAEVRSQARNEGINYAASRLAAAFNHGFVDKPLAEVYDVVRMILTAKEDLANDPAADGLSGEYAEKSLVEFAAQLRQGVAQ